MTPTTEPRTFEVLACPVHGTPKWMPVVDHNEQIRRCDRIGCRRALEDVSGALATDEALRAENIRLREFAFGPAPEWERANCTLKHRVRELEAEITLPLDKADRHVILQGLAKLNFGYARQLAEKIKATKCPTCGGNGYAKYVGGDDDDDACSDCNGDGFR